MNLSSSPIENIVVGGGIIGLSIAYELAKRGRQVMLLEQNRFGEQASWAGAGTTFSFGPLAVSSLCS